MRRGEPLTGDTERVVGDASVEPMSLLDTMLGSQQYGLVIYDRELRFVAWNQFMERITELRADDVLGKHATELFPQMATSGVLAMLERALAGETVRSPDRQFEIPGRGESGWLVGHFLPRLDQRGDVVGVVTLIEDITERKQVEETLQDREEQLERTQRIAHLGSWELDLTTNELSWSEEVYRIFGLRPQEFDASYEAFLERLHPDDRKEVDAAYTGSIREGRGSYEIEHRVVRADTGEVRWVRERCEHVRDVEGHVVASVGMVLDITDRKLAEQALLASQRELALHNRIAEVFLTSPEAEMYGRVLGIVLEELESEHGVFGYLAPDGSLVIPSWTEEVFEACRVDNPTAVFPREAWGGLWGQALIEKRTVLSNTPGHVPEGHIPIRRSIFAPITHHDEVIGLLAVANRDRDYGSADAERLEHIASHVAPILSARLTRDLFEREQESASEALRESEARYRAIVDHQSELVLRFDPDGTVIFVNDAVCRYTETSRGNLLGENVFGLVSQEMAERTRQHLATLTPDRPVGRNEIEWLNPEGELRWISWINHAFYDDEGRIKEFQSVGRDETERRRHEEDLRWALGEKELLLREIHHRVKNNLAVISGMLRLQAAGLEDERVNDVFDTMHKRIRTMALVHEQLYRSGRFGEVALREYLGRVVESLHGGPGRGGTPISISADIEDVILQIDQAIPCGLIVTELVNNALQHGFPEGGGGSIRVSLRSRDDGGHELTVRDDGVGLPVSDRNQSGPGFGLEMVGLLATQLGGTLDVCSGGGTEVTVLFPGDAG